jgi:septal ring factor EnvC (AmiA/AmiB activator)
VSEGMSEELASDWHDDASITDEQIEAVRVGLGNGSDGVPVYYQFSRAVVRKMLAEIDRLNTVLDANRVVRNAAESSSRTYKAVVDRLKAERTELRAEIDRCAGLNRDLVNENAGLSTELDRLRAQLAEIGETSVEWGVHWADKPEPTVYEFEDEARREVAGANSSDDVPNAELKVRRAPGQWCEVPDA